jgi:hypothetical protein
VKSFFPFPCRSKVVAEVGSGGGVPTGLQGDPLFQIVKLKVVDIIRNFYKQE